MQNLAYQFITETNYTKKADIKLKAVLPQNTHLKLVHKIILLEHDMSFNFRSTTVDISPYLKTLTANISHNIWRLRRHECLMFLTVKDIGVANVTLNF